MADEPEVPPSDESDDRERGERNLLHRWQLGVSVFPDNAKASLDIPRRPDVRGDVDGVEHRIFKLWSPLYPQNGDAFLVVEADGYQTARLPIKLGPDNPDPVAFPHWPELPAVHLEVGGEVPAPGEPWTLGISVEPGDSSVAVEAEGHQAEVKSDGPVHHLISFTTPPFTPNAHGQLTASKEGFLPVTQELPIGPNNPDAGAYPHWPELPVIKLQPEAGPEPPIPPEPPVGEGRKGVVRASGRATQDDTGFFHPLGTTFFWAMQGWKHDRERMQQNARWVQSKGFDYVRILCEVGWSVNPPGPIDPTTWPDYDQVLSEVIDYFYDTLGMRVELTIRGGGTSANLVDLANRIGDIVAAGRQHKILDLECANEYDRVNPTIEMQAMIPMADALIAKVPNRVALSSPGSWGDLDAAVKEGHGNAFTFHSDRGPGDYKWRQVRQGYDCKDVRHWLSSNEPPGPGSSVSVNDNPLQLTMLRAVSAICGGSAWVFHTGTGVFGNGTPGATGPRPANFWEIDNIDAIVAPIRRLDALLPEGVENWQIANTQWTPPNPVAPFQMHNHWPPGQSGVNKAYSALSGDGRWIQLPCGVLEHVDMTASYPLSNIRVYDPITHAVVQEHASLAQGQVMSLPGTTDTMMAYIITGTR